VNAQAGRGVEHYLRFTIYDLRLRGIVALARADAEAGAVFDIECEGAEASVARVGGRGVVAEDVLVREVCGDLGEGVGEFRVRVRDEDRAAGLRGELFEAALAREVVQVGALAVSGLDGVDLAIVGEKTRHRRVEVE